VQKKLLIAAAAAVVGMLALTPLAFANDYDRDRGGNETASFSYEDDSVQRNQVNLCSSDQDADVLPSTLVGAILPSVSQEQNRNCVNIADGAGGSEPTPPPSSAPTVEDVSPTATRVEQLENGRYAFGWDSELAPTLMDGDITFTIFQACPDGWTPTVIGQFTASNEANEPLIGYELINNGLGVEFFWIGNTPPAAPYTITYVSACQPPA
jgi:hypothetical protein